MTCERYLEQAKSNEEAARSIENSYPDWTVIMCFYAGLHLVEYYACQKGEDISNQIQNKSPHDSRRDYIRRLAKKLNNKNVEKLYNSLEEVSQISRYLKGIKYISAVAYFKDHKSDVNKTFDKLQQFKDILDKHLV
ncbi:MAG: hypothetical protein VKL60_10455 [Sphaerospermopsis sp.]|nr:hypothetical protein [Sphaerospermopsis sp.]